jgi:hypothetical protein
MPWLKLRRATGRRAGGDCAPARALLLLLLLPLPLLPGPSALAAAPPPLSVGGVWDGDRRTRRRWSSGALLPHPAAGELDRARGVTGLAGGRGTDLPRVAGPLLLLGPRGDVAPPLPLLLAAAVAGATDAAAEAGRPALAAGDGERPRELALRGAKAPRGLLLLLLLLLPTASARARGAGATKLRPALLLRPRTLAERVAAAPAASPRAACAAAAAGSTMVETPELPGV